MAASDYYLIILDNPSDAQRNAVHARIKKATKTWWHQYENVWIVGGGAQTTEWSERLQPVFKRGLASFLVLSLPAADETRGWAYFGPDATSRLAWLHKNYTADKR